MRKIQNIKFQFVSVDNPESEMLLRDVYSRIFQKAYENITKNEAKPYIIKDNGEYEKN